MHVSGRFVTSSSDICIFLCVDQTNHFLYKYLVYIPQQGFGYLLLVTMSLPSFTMLTPRSHHDIFDLFHQCTQVSIPFFWICSCTLYAVSIREQTVSSIHIHHFMCVSSICATFSLYYCTYITSSFTIHIKLFHNILFPLR